MKRELLVITSGWPPSRREESGSPSPAFFSAAGAPAARPPIEGGEIGMELASPAGGFFLARSEP